MQSLINTEMVKAAVVSEYGSMFVNAGEEFEEWFHRIKNVAYSDGLDSKEEA